MPLLEEWQAAASLHWFRRMQEHPDRLWAKNMRISLNKAFGIGTQHPVLLDKERLGYIYPHTLKLVENWLLLNDTPELTLTALFG